MTEYRLLIEEDALEFIESLDEKSERICKSNLKKLADNPYPGEGPGDTERLVLEGETVYRLHIGRTFTAFYDIDEDVGVVRILEVLSIDDAHKRYGF